MRRTVAQPAPGIRTHPVAPLDQELQAVLEFAAFLASEGPNKQHPLALVGPDGEHHAIPASLLQVLRQAIPLLARGESVTLLPSHRVLTTQEAADLLNVSRQYVVRLTDEGKLPFTRTGTHRRVHYEDVLAYKTLRDRERRAGLRTLTRMSRELGLYDVPAARSA